MFRNLWIWEDIPISGICDNSQRIEKGNVFLCQKGESFDGADYVADAIRRGAVAIIADRPIEAPVPVIEERYLDIGSVLKKQYLNGSRMKIIGVTGTNGKTTVTHLIKDALLFMNKRVGVIGTNGVYFGQKKLELFSSTPTTPKLCELYCILSELEKLGAEYAVMEVSSHALELDRVSGLEFEVGAFSNLSHDHLDFHKTIENYKKAKKKLFSKSKTSVINVDDATGAENFGSIKGDKLSVGCHYADLLATAVSMTAGGSLFTLEYGGKAERVESPFVGRFNVYNSLLSAGVLISLGFELSDIAEALSSASLVSGRMERLDVKADFDVIIDYAHTPDGLEKVIHTLKGIARGRVITVFGCGGDRDRTKRPVMGEISGRYADLSIITSDNPRCEDEMQIIRDIYDGIKKTDGDYLIIPDRKQAIAHAIAVAKPGDVLLLAGKGAEDYQIIGKEKRHFNEREIVRECLEGKGK